MILDDFNIVLLENLQRLGYFALKLTRDKVRADSLLNDAVINIIENYDKFDGQREFFPWASGFVYRSFMSGLKKTNTENHYTTQFDTETYILRTATAPAQHNLAEAKEVLRELYRLPKELIPAMELRAMGLNESEIADELKLPLTTIKNRVFKAKHLLAKSLNGDYKIGKNTIEHKRKKLKAASSKGGLASRNVERNNDWVERHKLGEAISKIAREAGVTRNTVQGAISYAQKKERSGGEKAT